ncbi:MAG: hypothetical protein ACI8TX_003735 [Hyphomicrobiaceae bacterium]|jgi:hypothetical protein
MEQNYTALVKQNGEWWIGWIGEVPGVNCQETSRAELLESLRVTLGEAIDLNRAEARSAERGAAASVGVHQRQTPVFVVEPPTN